MKDLNFWLLSSLFIVWPALLFSVEGGRRQFLEEGPGASARAQGGAFTAVADDLTAMFYNPSGLAFQGGSFYAEHLPVFDGGRLNFLGFHYPSGIGSFGLGVYQFAVDDIERRFSLGEPADEIRASQTAWFFPYAISFKSLGVGVALKKFDCRMDDHSKSTYGLDGGILCSKYFNDRLGLVEPALTVGFDVRNINEPGYSLISQEEKLPREYVAGVSFFGNLMGRFSSQKNEVIYDKIRFSFDFSKTSGGGTLPRYGFSYSLLDLIQFYAGAGINLTCGLGYGRSQGGIKMDYALAMTPLSPQHCFSFSYRFSDPKPRVDISPRLRKYNTTKKDAERLKRKFLDQGGDALKRREYERAVENFENARVLEPGNKDLRDYVRRAKEATKLRRSNELLQKAKKDFDDGAIDQWSADIFQAARIMPENLEVSEAIIEFKIKLNNGPGPIRLKFEEKRTNELNLIEGEFNQAIEKGDLAQARTLVQVVNAIDIRNPLTRKLTELLKERQKRNFDHFLDQANLSLSKGNFQEAFGWFEKSREIYPSNADLKNQFGEFISSYEKNMNFSRYDRLYQEQLYSLAAIRYVKGDFEDSRNYLEELLEKNAVHENGQFLRKMMLERNQIVEEL